jgi:AcrR family transcriptional regulator
MERSFFLGYAADMPRITPERREARRQQILEAARACLQEQGLEVSMETIVTRSGLSTGAVYGYFTGKDQIINAVITDGTAALGRELASVLGNPEPPALPDLIGHVLDTVAGFGRHKKGDIDRLLVSLHGWSHTQTVPELKKATQRSYSTLRTLFADAVKRSQANGSVNPSADPDDLAQLLTSITLGFAAQRALTGSADPKAHASALRALTASAASVSA